MKTNIQSLPFGSYGKICVLKEHCTECGKKTVATILAEGLMFQHCPNFDILRKKLLALPGFQNIVVDTDPEDMDIYVRFDLEVCGPIRNTKGLLRSLRKKIQKASALSYKCLTCMDSGLNFCPECTKRKEERAQGDYLDLQGELALRQEESGPDWHMEGDERVYEQDDEYEDSICSYCREPLSECVCDD